MAFGNTIPLARESKYKLKDILIPTNENAQDGLYIFYLEKNLRMPDFSEILEEICLSLKKGSIRLSQEDLEPTEEYINAVENALSYSDDGQEQREAFNRVGEACILGLFAINVILKACEFITEVVQSNSAFGPCPG
ncbi:8927_t:CDS:2, partial [Dentiscutata erythropus]